MHSPAEGLLVPWLMLSLLAQHTGTLWGEQGGLALTQVEDLGHLYIMKVSKKMAVNWRLNVESISKLFFIYLYYIFIIYLLAVFSNSTCCGNRKDKETPKQLKRNLPFIFKVRLG